VRFPFSCAVDKDFINQDLSGSEFTVVSSSRVLWDVGEVYDIPKDRIVIPTNCLINFDIQLRVQNIVNCEKIELALFKKGEPDDYWFILDYKAVGSETELQLKGATQFDMYGEEEFDVRIKLHPVVGQTPTATIIGDDDFTAWGFSATHQI
jgi:hypothetical protein